LSSARRGFPALALAISFSPVYPGVHNVSDVVAGYSAGLAWLMLCALGMLGASWLRAGRARVALTRGAWEFAR
jgi:membrane-associated phospholipid phosphatase